MGSYTSKDILMFALLHFTLEFKFFNPSKGIRGRERYGDKQDPHLKGTSLRVLNKEWELDSIIK